ncbi:3-(3-hydroxy-phenyl)propionate hydroxylase [Plasticicumulans lactativorans]|uniref:3-(3-hydroxy-phenyl)propionate hydroxylase n=1 Tax=Plasticicumulans lactativorans TaxID=1133106 RepID=A0A4R2L111_9GAMM|nr:FAD-dependent oxidoreductase [Plasticicumulans lactativorans]TCO79262.1 3-(3-hydroxy-phenyl)propionate hydroxylase [Plasticicumulans lactativorans]
MLSTYQYPKFAYTPPPELAAGTVRRVPVVVVGAGPVGLATAIDLARHGVPVLLLDDDDTVSIGSRGVCYAKRTLEVLDRLGCGDAVVDKGVSWNVGRTFFREEEVYNFDLLPQAGHKRPGMINLQQYYLEEFLNRRAAALPAIEQRWKNRVVSVTPQDDGALLKVETPDGIYALAADWLVVADGARSPIRRMLGLDIDGKIFMDRFLIADVVMQAAFPPERWFWFDPPFHPNQSALLHREADDVWRLDFQLGWNADPEEEKKPENVIPRIRAMLGDERPFELEWVSVYTFQCRRMGRFNHGRVLFVGDAAHQVSPFGARGANSGIQDADNLAWKLALVIDGRAPARLLDSYSDERVYAADENLLNSTRSTDFITPKSGASKQFRNAVLELAREHAFARALVNSGRLSVPSVLVDSPLNTPDGDAFAGWMLPGAPLDDAPVRAGDAPGWLLEHTGGGFTGLYFAADPARIAAPTRAAFAALAAGPLPVEVVVVAARPGSVDGARVLVDADGLAAQRYDATDGTFYLVRPDQHVCARWRALDVAAVGRALARATAQA